MRSMTQIQENEDRAVREVLFGQVVTVRPVPTRGVTQVVIEIPSEFHIKATQLLFDQNALVFASDESIQMPYGIAQLAGGEIVPAQPAQPKRVQSQGSAFDVTRWLALRCKEGEFWQFLGCTSEAAAIDRVRQICEVDSRADIAQNDRAMSLFKSEILEPFQARKTLPRRFGVVK